MNLNVTKADGTRQPFDQEKINKVVIWAADGLENVSPSQVILNSKLKFHEGISTKDIHESLVKSAAELITLYESDYQYLAARLLMFSLRKQAYGKFIPPKFYLHTKKMVAKNIYDKHIIEDYSKQEFEILEKVIEHERDMKLTYGAVRTYQRKYLTQDRVTKLVYDSPQYVIMLISMVLFSNTKTDRILKVKKFYKAVTEGKLSLPTPIMSGVRTPTRQFSSCVLIDCDDNMESIGESNTAILNYVSRRAGIGLNVGRIRAEGSYIRGGEAVHTGLTPFIKMFQSTVGSCSQGGVRKGSATLGYPIWHHDFESLIVLKNNKGTDDNRARHLDYNVHINKLFIERLISNSEITFFSPDVANGKLYELFYSDQKGFKKLYEKLEQDDTIRKKTKQAIDVFTTLLTERSQTARVYLLNSDHFNDHSAFTIPLYMSNLCLEIGLPTKPVTKTDGEIALCTLAAFNVGAIEDSQEYEELSELIVEALDNLLDYQHYALEAARIGGQDRRSLGIGITNYAYWLAKNNLKYSDGSANNETYSLFETISYYLTKASNKLSMERGSCKLFNDTKYSKGILPIDTYKKDIDSKISVSLQHNWDELRENILKYGLRNSTLMAIMPCETSSLITNSTNGIEPPRKYVQYKDSADGIIKQVLPDIKNLYGSYELAWDINDNTGYLTLTGIMQVFVDQAISVNSYYNPKNYENGKVPLQILIKDLITWYQLGNKTWYYHNTNDGNDDGNDDCSGGGCKI